MKNLTSSWGRVVSGLAAMLCGVATAVLAAEPSQPYVDVNGDGYFQSKVDRLITVSDLTANTTFSIDDGGLVIPAGVEVDANEMHLSVLGDVTVRGTVNAYSTASIESRTGSITIAPNGLFWAANAPLLSAAKNVVVRPAGTAAVEFDTLTLQALNGSVMICPNASLFGGQTIQLIANSSVKLQRGSLVSAGNVVVTSSGSVFAMGAQLECQASNVSSQNGSISFRGANIAPFDVSSAGPYIFWAPAPKATIDLRGDDAPANLLQPSAPNGKGME